MNRFEGYNRNDYHFNRTSREAFGRYLSAKDFEPEDNIKVVARRFLIAVAIIMVWALVWWS